MTPGSHWHSRPKEGLMLGVNKSAFADSSTLDDCRDLKTPPWHTCCSSAESTGEADLIQVRSILCKHVS